MPPLAELGKFKRLAELFVLAMKVNLTITAEQHQIALRCLMEYDLTEHQAESLLNSGFEKLDRGLIRNPDVVIQAVADAFRYREHNYILLQVQSILEAQPITEAAQEFFDRCCRYLYHEDV